VLQYAGAIVTTSGLRPGPERHRHLLTVDAARALVTGVITEGVFR
jgi:hypothetical protein